MRCNKDKLVQWLTIHGKESVEKGFIDEYNESIIEEFVSIESEQGVMWKKECRDKTLFLLEVKD